MGENRKWVITFDKALERPPMEESTRLVLKEARELFRRFGVNHYPQNENEHCTVTAITAAASQVAPRITARFRVANLAFDQLECVVFPRKIDPWDRCLADWNDATDRETVLAAFDKALGE